jgi:uncharacterized heparinase superfamily protein
MNPDVIGRWLRTIRNLNFTQIAGRIPRRLISRTIRTIPTSHAPSLRCQFEQSNPEVLGDFAKREARRASSRLATMAPSHLHDFEKTYGFEALAGRLWQNGTSAIQPYPSAVRARNLAIASRLIASGTLTASFSIQELERELARCCRAIMLQLEIDILGNHLLEDAFGLLCAACVTRGPEAELWWLVGSGVLYWQLHQQFLPDGAHFELSGSYHLWLTAALLLVIGLACQAGRAVPEEWTTMAAHACGYALAIEAPDGTFPLFNDASLDAGPSIRCVVELAEWAGVDVLRSPRIEIQQVGEFRATHCLDSGWLMLAGPDCWLAIDAGADGARNQPGHVHADALTFELWLAKTRAIVDYGVESYERDDARKRTRATSSHNTVVVGGQDTCEVWAAFRVGRRQTAMVECLSVTASKIRIIVHHDGYRHRGSLHQRVFVLEPFRLRIEDMLSGREKTQGTSYLRFVPSVVTTIKGSHPLRTEKSRWYPKLGLGEEALVLGMPFRERGWWEIGWE